MTLSLDDVRNKRFRLARKSGYEVAEVDDFLDQLQESFAQLIEENENLKKQVDALGDETSDARTSDAPADASVAPAVAAAPHEPAEPETVVVTTSSEASMAVVRLVQLSTEHAEQLVAEANAEAERIRAEADHAAQKLSSDTQTEAERLAAEARERAESVRADAQSRAAQLDAETTERRQQLFGALDQERTTLAGAIEELRQFEQTFRSNLTDQLRRHIDILESGHAEPGDLPELATSSASIGAPTTDPADTAATTAEASTEAGTDEDVAVEGGTREHGAAEDESADEGFETDPDATVQVSDTPRLDALLGDQR
jgi:DivIVA domain-containing protein